MDTTDLHSNEWLSTMYHFRSRWVPAYVNHIFSAGMSSSQRAESGHSFFKKYVNRNNSLMGFITRFNRALTHQRHEELVCSHVDMNEQPRITSMVMMEEQMVNIYTKKIFLLFQKEIGQSNLYICSKKSSCAEFKKYSVHRFELGSNFQRQREVTYYKDMDYISCSCRTFEFEGYPCRHMMCFFKIKQIILLPEKYILRRWMKNAKVGILYDINSVFGMDDGPDKSLMARHGLLAHKASMIVDDASLTDARSNYLLVAKACEQQGIEDPIEVRAKGCGKRLKSSKEKAISRGNRQCGVCGAVGHDKRTCSNVNFNSRSNMDSFDFNNMPNEPVRRYYIQYNW
ncbi:Protein FAR1-RELATED SEQUENCE 5 [Abeliophyllum distichum]|uniref:Protein FAR1-RELATED SEQUENCE n=1 Tax=Abeliophyllum distichum TaxID=126358 RepID=A0ABD1QGC4_9LAMI